MNVEYLLVGYICWTKIIEHVVKDSSSDKEDNMEIQIGNSHVFMYHLSAAIAICKHIEYGITSPT
jgi:hypothetical protein